jgi:hypothetical protein
MKIKSDIPNRKITWRQASILASISLREAEKRRRNFAEQEARVK